VFSESGKKVSEFINQMEMVLLKGEIDLKTTQFSPGTLQSLIQVLHQIKSELALLGRPRAASLIHDTGEQLSALKKGRGRLTAEMIQGLFGVVDILRANLHNPREEENFPKQFYSPSPSQKSYDNIYFPLTSSEIKSLEISLTRGKVYLLEKAIPPFLNAEQIAALIWYTRLKEEEDILFIHPEFKRLSMLEEEQVVSVVFTSQRSKDSIKAEFQSPVLEIRKTKPQRTKVKDRIFPLLDKGQWRILVIEDDFFDRHFLQENLSRYGKVDVATTAREARTAIQQSLAQKAPYHLITLDQFLGSELGEHLIQDLRQMEKDQGSFASKVLVISQDTSGETIMNLLQKDVQGYMVKPLTVSGLHRHLEKLPFSL
jgi:CheY-like chemotaxis protein